MQSVFMHFPRFHVRRDIEPFRGRSASAMPSQELRRELDLDRIQIDAIKRTPASVIVNDQRSDESFSVGPAIGAAEWWSLGEVYEAGAIRDIGPM